MASLLVSSVLMKMAKSFVNAVVSGMTANDVCDKILGVVAIDTAGGGLRLP